MVDKNLSEILFKPTYTQRETSTLIQRTDNINQDVHSILEGDTNRNWYRTLNRLIWIWRGIAPIELEMVLSKIAASDAERSNEKLFDTVVGYRSGNWIYEWIQQGMVWQQKALDIADKAPETAANYWINAASFFSIAGYPYLRGDELADQASLMTNRAFEEAGRLMPYDLKTLSFNVEGGQLKGFLYLPGPSEQPLPTVILCGGLDNLQHDYYRFFHDYLAPAGIAMLTIDMPSIGFSSSWRLGPDSSILHQQVLAALADIPWVDSTRVAILGFRFGANVAVRLGYLEPKRLKAVACVGPIVHSLLADPKYRSRISPMHLDVLASRLGIDNSSNHSLQMELGRFSLKLQGLLGRRCALPLFSLHWDNDPFSPLEESKLIVNSSSDGKLLKIKTDSLVKNLHQGLQQVTEWLVEKLKG